MKWGNIFKVIVIAGIVVIFFLVGFTMGFVKVINMSTITRTTSIITTILEGLGK